MSLSCDQRTCKLKRDDTVEVISGKDKGKRGRLLKIFRGRGRVVVEGLNIVKKAQKRHSKNERGGIVELEAPMHISNVMLVCKECGPTRVGYKQEGISKMRVCKKCGEIL